MKVNVRKLKKAESRSRRILAKMKRLNVRMVKVCFGPCRCFSAAKRP